MPLTLSFAGGRGAHEEASLSVSGKHNRWNDSRQAGHSVSTVADSVLSLALLVMVTQSQREKMRIK